MQDIIFILIGFSLLIFGGERFVMFSSSLARKLGVSSMLIGLTVVAFGTSLPELAVSLTAAFKGSPDISVGNVTGSNLFNLLVILGFCAIFNPVAVSKTALRRDIPASLAAALMLALISAYGMIDRLCGFLLLAAFGGVTFFQIKSSHATTSDEDDAKPRPFWYLLLGITAAISAIIIGGTVTVNGAVGLARWMGMSERIIGLTIISIGTSLPELVTSIVASIKHENDIAVGNVIGSNIFNILLILGATGMVCPIKIGGGTIVDCIVIAAATIFFIVAARRGVLSRWAGAVMFAGYVTHIWIQAT